MSIHFYKCNETGAIFPALQGVPAGNLTELIPGTTDAAQEKHVPAVVVDGNTIRVTVGSVEHPMLDVHYIQWIVLETKKGFEVKYLVPDTAPYAEFIVADGDEPVAAYEYCNLHGLWKADI